jgi:hypothetical protein
MSQARQFAWYRFRATWRRRWSGYLGIVLVIGLVGGVAMAAVAGARRTQTSFSVFLAKTNPSDLAVLTGLYQPDPTGYDPVLIQKISKLPYVTRVQSEGGYEYVQVGPQGYPLPRTLTGAGPQVALYSSIDGLFWHMDHLIVLGGHLPNPKSVDDVAVTPYGAQLLGARVGSTIRIGVVGDRQSTSLCKKCKPVFRTTIKIVAIVITSADLVVDDTDRDATIFATTAFSHQTLKCCLDPTITFMQIAGGARHLPAVESEISRILPKHFPRMFSPTSSASAATAQRVIGPDVVALYLFGLIVALVALLVAGQMIGRQLKLGSDDLDIVRALGAGPSMTAADGLVGIVAAITAGSVLAGVVAVALSPLLPIGPVGPVYPDKGLSFDGLVIGVGFVSIVLVLGAVAVVIAVLQAPHRPRRRPQSTTGASVFVRWATAIGLPAPAITGIRFAVVPGRGRQSAPVRSAAVGAVVAVSVVVASLSVGASLDALASQPRLYGWNWTVAMTAAGGVGVLPEKALVRELDHDHGIAAWSGMFFAQVEVDGQSVPALATSPRASVQPPVLSGHGLRGRGQVVLGSDTLKQLHKRIGQSVMVGTSGGASHKLRIVGTATFPAYGGSPHTEMGTGALVDYRLIPPSSRNIFNLPGGGPNVAFVRLRAPNSKAELAKLRAITPILARAAQDTVSVVTVQRPAEIADAGTLRATPSVLAAALAAGAVLALGVTLVTSVRRRRRDLALLKVLGFTRRQLAATLAWQSTIAATFGIVFGIPIGVVGGRELWSLFARSIYAVPDPVTPALSIIVVGVGALIFAVLVAWPPGRSAARVSPAEILRSE